MSNQLLNVLSLTPFVAMSWDAPKVRLYPYFKQISPDQTLCVAIGAMAKGQDDFADSYVEEKIGK
jgi:rRNA small subunit pseudouridine methyltransferase Nep1